MNNDIFNGAKKLGFGLMRLPTNTPDNAADIDIEQVKKMTARFIEQGFTYFDTALMYCGMESERAVKKFLTSRHPRDSFTLATKLHYGFMKIANGFLTNSLSVREHNILITIWCMI